MTRNLTPSEARAVVLIKLYDLLEIPAGGGVTMATIAFLLPFFYVVPLTGYTWMAVSLSISFFTAITLLVVPEMKAVTAIEDYFGEFIYRDIVDTAKPSSRTLFLVVLNVGIVLWVILGLWVTALVAVAILLFVAYLAEIVLSIMIIRILRRAAAQQ